MFSQPASRNTAANQEPPPCPIPQQAPRPSLSSQSGGHWAVARRTALPKIPCVSPRLDYVGSVLCRLRPVCKVASFFICCLFLSPQSLFLPLPLCNLSACLSPAKFGMYPFSVCFCVPLYVFASGLLSFCFPLQYLSPTLLDPPREGVAGVCAHVLLSNWTSLK